MTMKATDLAKNRGLKINNKLANAASPARFGGAAPVLDKRQQREADRALGLVPFACKLPAELVRTLQARAADHADGLNGLVRELLEHSLEMTSDEV